jgi:hypothetical protein
MSINIRPTVMVPKELYNALSAPPEPTPVDRLFRFSEKLKRKPKPSPSPPPPPQPKNNDKVFDTLFRVFMDELKK